MAKKAARKVATKAKRPKKKPPARKRPAGAGASFQGKVIVIKYKCNGSCKATPNSVHMDPGDIVLLTAVNTDVTIDFLGSSPFVSGTDPIKINNGQQRSEIVATYTGKFPYALICGSCSNPQGTPDMIVP